MKNLLITNGKVITLGDQNKVIDSGAVYIKDGKIADVGTEKALIKQYPQAERLDARGKIIMPGMICTHHHLYSTMARGMMILLRKPCSRREYAPISAMKFPTGMSKVAGLRKMSVS